MPRDVSLTIVSRLDDVVTRPGYLIEVPEVADFPALTSRNTQITWRNDSVWQPTFDFTISGLSWDGSGKQTGKIEFNDNARFDAENASTVSNIILFNKMAGKIINIYLFYYYGSTALSEDAVVGMFSGVIDECEISQSGRITINVTTDFIISLYSPRRYIRPSDPIEDSAHNTGFNSVPPAGTILTWNGDVYKLERTDN